MLCKDCADLISAQMWTFVVNDSYICVCVSVCVCALAYPSLRIEKNDLRSVTLQEAKAKVKDIAISRERVTLRDVLHEGASSFLTPPSSM